MSTIKNAFAALKRNKGRNTFIAIIMLVIITISCIALIIHNTANTIRVEQKAKFGSKVTLQLSEDAFKNYASSSTNDGSMSQSGVAISFPELDKTMLQQLAKSQYVKDTFFETGFSATSDTLQPVEKKNDGSTSSSFSSSVSIGGTTMNEDLPEPDYNVRGYSKNQGTDILSSSNRKLTAGNIPNDALECMISEELAKQNKINIGDKIKIKALQYDKSKPEPKEMELTISGLYQTMPSSDSNTFMFSQEDIFMLYESTLEDSYQNNAFLNTTYYLNSPEDLQAFEQEARSLHLPEEYEVMSDETTYQQVVGPIDGMAQISFLFLIVVLSLGGALLVLLTIMNVRDRNYEIGILRSLGMRKQHVIMQMIMEPIFIVSCVFVIGCGMGTLIAQPISDTLLANQMKTSEESQMSGGIVIMNSSIEQIESIKEMPVILNSTTLFQVFSISSFLVIISGLISCIYIVKYEPMEILSERR